MIQSCLRLQLFPSFLWLLCLIQGGDTVGRNIQCSPFQAVTSNIYCLKYLLLLFKIVGILENSTGKKIALLVWKFILPVMLKIEENTEY